MSRRGTTIESGDFTGSAPSADLFASPRLAQSILTILFALDLTLRFSGEPASGRWPQLGALILVVVTVATLVSRWERLPPTAPIAVAVADIAVMGLTRLDPQGEHPGSSSCSRRSTWAATTPDGGWW